MKLMNKEDIKYQSTVIQDTKFEEGDIVYWVSKEYIDSAPEIEAIPIEWIKNYRDFMRNKEKGEWLGQFELNVAYGLDIMLGIWEAENETN